MIDARSFGYICEIERRLRETEINMRTVMSWLKESGQLDLMTQASDDTDDGDGSNRSMEK